MRHASIFAVLAVLVVAAAPAAAQEPSLRIERAFPGLSFRSPVFLTAPPDGSDRLFVVEQRGVVRVFENRDDVSEAPVAIDISRRVQAGGEEGLLGLAFHPDFATNRQVFLHYTARPGRRNVLARYTADSDGTTIDPDSEEVLLTAAQPWANHNGGMIAFGPDGYLYISLGDGGAAADPQNNGQRLDTLLGKILRIDVDRTADGRPYAVPRDNPFVGEAGARPEIWALGLRNAWRFSFDRETGELWAGDVGQNAWEEIDVITRGGNYGWRIREGFHDFRGDERPSTTPLIDPVVEHGRREAISITGGYVYRGRAIPELRGAYVYGDYGTGLVWWLRRESDARPEPVVIGRAPQISSFGEDRDGELYIVGHDGVIHRIVAR